MKTKKSTCLVEHASAKQADCEFAKGNGDNKWIITVMCLDIAKTGGTYVLFPNR